MCLEPPASCSRTSNQPAAPLNAGKGSCQAPTVGWRCEGPQRRHLPAAAGREHVSRSQPGGVPEVVPPTNQPTKPMVPLKKMDCQLRLPQCTLVPSRSRPTTKHPGLLLANTMEEVTVLMWKKSDVMRCPQQRHLTGAMTLLTHSNRCLLLTRQEGD